MAIWQFKQVSKDELLGRSKNLIQSIIIIIININNNDKNWLIFETLNYLKCPK